MVLGLEVGVFEAGRRLRERAVPAFVATEHRERNEHLRRIRHPGAEGLVADP